jgi:cyanophycinase
VKIKAIAVCAVSILGALALYAASGPSKGYLVIIGGGEFGQAIFSRYVTLAGGPDASYVLIPTAADDPDIDRVVSEFHDRFHLAGIRRLTVLHTRDRKIADSFDFTAPLRSANAVFISGGRQWRLADAYLNTRTQRELQAVLDRGGVVGGNSAGASILASYLTRGAPEGNKVVAGRGHVSGFGFLRGAAIDQHIDERGRENDLREIIRSHPELLGIGLDTYTAIVVHGDSFEVTGPGSVHITLSDHPIFSISGGARFDMHLRKVIQ